MEQGRPPMEQGHPPMEFRHGPPSFDPFRGLIIYTIIFMISTGIKMTIEWFKNDLQKRELENDKLSAELSMLKAQINPHFFFNVLNNICSLARSKSEETETYIIKLSQLMRYNIYEQKEDKVLLKKEVQFIEDYIDIQKMRLINTVEVVFNKTGNLNHYHIELMLLFPFIENAFKYGISYEVNSKITINLSVGQDSLVFSVFNTIHKSIDSIPHEKDKGIGLQNVLKRLSLLYADKHEISINNNDEEFSVLLKLKL
jgi:LytS/YehU family sensor histidine kinase